MIKIFLTSIRSTYLDFPRRVLFGWEKRSHSNSFPRQAYLLICRRSGLPGLSAYSTSKFAVRGLTQSAGMWFIAFVVSSHVLNSFTYPLTAQELAPHNICVNSFAPGQINTPMSERRSSNLFVYFGLLISVISSGRSPNR